MDKIISIIVTHYGSSVDRSNYMRRSIDSLIETTRNLPCEIIVIDNGGNTEDSKWLLDLNTNGKINVYIRNSVNMSFGYARNQGLRLSNGDYICIADNDIEYTSGWLEKCLVILDAYPDRRIWATPLYNVAHWLPKYWAEEELDVDGEKIRLNFRAGSNCWVMRRMDFKKVGEFLPHRIAGTKWTERAIRLHYVGAITPTVMVHDLAFRNGYNFQDPKPIKLTLSNGDEKYFNVDEFKIENGNLDFIKQRKFRGKQHAK